MSSPARVKNNFGALLGQIQADYPRLNFKADKNFRWSPENHTVYFDPAAEYADWSLLHELGHMIRGHSRYTRDAALVKMEVEAWDTAVELAAGYGHQIDQEYVQDCIDSYRNWQYRRSACPRCEQTGLEHTDGQYRCINCRETWAVTPNRFCRVYRRRVSSLAK